MARLKKSLVGAAGEFLLDRMIKKLRSKSYLGALETGEKWGRIAHRLMGSRRQQAIDNLRMCFPTERFVIIEETVQHVFESFGRSMADFLYLGGTNIELLLKTTRIEGIENLENALAKGKGVILMAGHVGNWERGPMMISHAGHKIGVVIRDADTEGVNHIINGIREAAGTVVLARGKETRRILEMLRSNGIVGILSDQNSDGIYLPFFGHLAGTNPGAGVLAAKTGAAVLFASCVYEGKGNYLIQIREPIKESKDQTGEETMREFHSWLEDLIRQYPDQWLWFHDRWRNAKRKGLL